MNVLRDIEKIISILPKSFTGLNFEPSKYKDCTGRVLPMYMLTRSAFSIVVMGFSGREAILWKMKYIQAFDELEKLVLENAREKARQKQISLSLLEIERKKAYLEGMNEGKKLAKREDRLYVLERLIRFVRAGLSHAEMGLALGISKNAVQKRISFYKKKGYWPKSLASIQGNLLEVYHA